MFEAYQLLSRLRDHFGYECSVVLGMYEDVVAISVSWPDFTAEYGMTLEVVSSAVSADMLEKVVILNLENKHKLWEVGEI